MSVLLYLLSLSRLVSSSFYGRSTSLMHSRVSCPHCLCPHTRTHSHTHTHTHTQTQCRLAIASSALFSQVRCGPPLARRRFRGSAGAGPLLGYTFCGPLDSHHTHYGSSFVKSGIVYHSQPLLFIPYSTRAMCVVLQGISWLFSRAFIRGIIL